MDFPTTEPDIMALAGKMLDGYFWYAADFPNINRIILSSKRLIYVVARKNHKQANAALRIATKAKNEKFSELKKVMQNCLKKSEVDVAANPEKLKLIGWSPKTSPQPAPLPSQPVNLRIAYRDNAALTLEWDRPADSSRVRNYIIERRQAQSTGWTIIEISYQTQVRLIQQPTGLQLEYRVKAANNAGTGPAGNTISIVL